MRFLGRNIEGWGEIVEAEPPRLLKIQGQGTEGSLLTTLYRMTPAGVGTDFQLEIDYELPAGIVGAVANKLFVEKAVERDLRHSVENFKALVEAQVPVLA
jgi:uncharacterized membrane protein